MKVKEHNIAFTCNSFVNIWLLSGLGANVFVLLSISFLDNGPLLRSFATSKVRQPDCLIVCLLFLWSSGVFLLVMICGSWPVPKTGLVGLMLGRVVSFGIFLCRCLIVLPALLSVGLSLGTFPIRCVKLACVVYQNRGRSTIIVVSRLNICGL